MRSKNILSIVAFITAFGLSVAFASLFISKNINKSASTYAPTNHCKFKRNSRTADAISKLIVADYTNAYVRDSKIYNTGENNPVSPDSVAFADYAQATKIYVDSSSNLSVENLPNDFKIAWQEHMKAWRDSSNFLNKSADISKRNSFTPEEFNDADEFFGQEINRTYEKVLEIGNSYGADIR